MTDSTAVPADGEQGGGDVKRARELGEAVLVGAVGGGSWYRAGWGAAESACSGGLSECVGGCGRVGGRGELVGRVGVEGRWSLLLLLMIVRASAGRVGSEGG